MAVSLARFGHKTRMVGVVANNSLGESAAGELRRHGVDTQGVQKAEGRMGLYFLTPGAIQRPVSYTHLDVYKRQGHQWNSGIESPNQHTCS